MQVVMLSFLMLFAAMSALGGLLSAIISTMWAFMLGGVVCIGLFFKFIDKQLFDEFEVWLQGKPWTATLIAALSLTVIFLSWGMAIGSRGLLWVALVAFIAAVVCVLMLGCRHYHWCGSLRNGWRNVWPAIKRGWRQAWRTGLAWIIVAGRKLGTLTRSNPPAVVTIVATLLALWTYNEKKSWWFPWNQGIFHYIFVGIGGVALFVWRREVRMMADRAAKLAVKLLSKVLAQALDLALDAYLKYQKWCFRQTSWIGWVVLLLAGGILGFAAIEVTKEAWELGGGKFLGMKVTGWYGPLLVWAGLAVGFTIAQGVVAHVFAKNRRRNRPQQASQANNT